jgi:hypothetical protein
VAPLGDDAINQSHNDDVNDLNGDVGCNDAENPNVSSTVPFNPDSFMDMMSRIQPRNSHVASGSGSGVGVGGDFVMAEGASLHITNNASNPGHLANVEGMLRDILTKLSSMENAVPGRGLEPASALRELPSNTIESRNPNVVQGQDAGNRGDGPR